LVLNETDREDRIAWTFGVKEFSYPIIKLLFSAQKEDTMSIFVVFQPYQPEVGVFDGSYSEKYFQDFWGFSENTTILIVTHENKPNGFFTHYWVNMPEFGEAHYLITAEQKNGVIATVQITASEPAFQTYNNIFDYIFSSFRWSENIAAGHFK